MNEKPYSIYDLLTPSSPKPEITIPLYVVLNTQFVRHLLNDYTIAGKGTISLIMFSIIVIIFLLTVIFGLYGVLQIPRYREAKNTPESKEFLQLERKFFNITYTEIFFMVACFALFFVVD